MNEQQTLTTTVPRWAAPASLVICVLGLLDAAYLVFEHYNSKVSFLCTESAHVNCAAVTTSKYSWFPPTDYQSSLLVKPHHVGFGIPVSVLGLAFFVVMALLCLPMVWRHTSRAVLMTRTGLAGLGVLSVLYLVWVELFPLNGTICLYCTGVHVLTVTLFVVVLLATALREPAADQR